MFAFSMAANDSSTLPTAWAWAVTASALRAILHVDELEPRPQGEGLRELPDAVRHRGRVHVMQSSKIKKWARGPLRLVSEGRKAGILYHLAKRPATVKRHSGHAYISSITGP